MIKDTMILALQSLIDAINNSTKIETFKFKSLNETTDYPQLFGPSGKILTGWTNITINIRLYRKMK